MDHMNTNTDEINMKRNRQRLPAQRVRISLLTLMTMSMVSLAGCSGWTDVKRALGMEKQPISDAEIVKLPPLVIPPDYQIRPPADGSPADPYPAAALTSGIEADIESKIDSGITSGGDAVAQVANSEAAALRQASGLPVVAPLPSSASSLTPSAALYPPAYSLPTDPALAVFNRAFWDYSAANFGSINRFLPMPSP